MIKELDKWLEESNQKGTEAYYELKNLQNKVKEEENRKQRYIKYIKDMGPELRAINIEKAVNKYDSDEYINKEYKMGRLPSKDLLWVLYEYACEYCPEYDSDEMFVSEAYIIDDRYLLERADGQGSIIIISKIYKK